MKNIALFSPLILLRRILYIYMCVCVCVCVYAYNIYDDDDQTIEYNYVLVNLFMSNDV